MCQRNAREICVFCREARTDVNESALLGAVKRIWERVCPSSLEGAFTLPRERLDAVDELRDSGAGRHREISVKL